MGDDGRTWEDHSPWIQKSIYVMRSFSSTKYYFGYGSKLLASDAGASLGQNFGPGFGELWVITCEVLGALAPKSRNKSLSRWGIACHFQSWSYDRSKVTRTDEAEFYPMSMFWEHFAGIIFFASQNHWFTDLQGFFSKDFWVNSCYPFPDAEIGSLCRLEDCLWTGEGMVCHGISSSKCQSWQ